MRFRYDILTALAQQLGAKDYLEIGVQRGETFTRIPVANKVGVDPDTGSAATHHMTSDAFFDQNKQQFDLVFIDGLHLSEQVLRDVENSMKVLRPGGVILLHDCNPPTEGAGSRSMCSGVWCGDVWRAWGELSAMFDGFFACADTDLGCGLILPENHPLWAGFDKVYTSEEARVARRVLKGIVSGTLALSGGNDFSLSSFKYSDFVATREGWLNLMPMDRFAEVVGLLPKVEHAA